jgi:hypothetical protein
MDAAFSALTVLKYALDRCRHEDTCAPPTLPPRSIFSLRQADPQWPFDQFRKALESDNPEGRWQNANATLNGIRLGHRRQSKMINRKAAEEREALLKRLRELYEEIAELRQDAGARAIEEQFRRNLERFIEAQMPHIAAKVHVEIVRPGANTAAVFSDPPQEPAAGTKIKKFLLQFGR